MSDKMISWLTNNVAEKEFDVKEAQGFLSLIDMGHRQGSSM